MPTTYNHGGWFLEGDNQLENGLKIFYNYENIIFSLDMFFSGLFGFDLYVSHFRESSGNDISEERLRLIEKKRAEVLDDCLHTAEELLKSNIDLVNKYIEELTDKYTLTHEEIMAIYNQMRPEAA